MDHDYRSIEKRLFRVADFRRDTALFPEPVFAKSWDFIGFLPFNDWFSDERDFEALQQFMAAIGGTSFISSAPPLYGIPSVETGAGATRGGYNDKHTMVSSEDNQLRGAGLRSSPEVFYYDGSGQWAMVADVTHHLLICGMDQAVVPHFLEAFGEVRDVLSLIADLERAHSGPIDQRELLLANY